MKVVAGKQFFVRKVLISGVELTKTSVVQQRVTAEAGRSAQSDGPAADAAQAL
jgi:hypothetical protein